MACPYAYYLTYLAEDHHHGSGNAFSDYGTFAHSLLDKWAKGELKPEQLQMEWEAGYEAAIEHEFPPFMKNYRDKARVMCSNYFASFNGFPGYDIVSSERRFTVPIGPYEFDGIADLVLKSQADGSLMVVDHKTKSTASMKKDIDRFRNQLYIYAAHVKDQYGEYPKTLAFNMLKTGELIKEEFTMEQMKATEAWATSTVDAICMDMEYKYQQDDFHCRFLCDVRARCTHCPIWIR